MPSKVVSLTFRAIRVLRVTAAVVVAYVGVTSKYLIYRIFMLPSQKARAG